MCWGFYTHTYTLLFFFLWRFRPHTVCWPAFAHHKAGTPLSNVMIVPGLRKWHVGKNCVSFHSISCTPFVLSLGCKGRGQDTSRYHNKGLQTGSKQPLRWMFSLKNIFWPRNGPRHWWYTALLLEKLPVCWEATGEWVMAECEQPLVW